MFRFSMPMVLAVCGFLSLGATGQAFADEPVSGRPQPAESTIVSDAKIGPAGDAKVRITQQLGNASGGSSNTNNPPSGVKQAVHRQTVSNAERITDLQRAIEADKQALQEIESALAVPDSEYHMAEADFQEVDGQHENLKHCLKRAQEQKETVEAQRLKVEIEELQSQWKLAKDRFDLAIQERKTIQQKAANLKQKIQQELETLDKLTGTAAPVPEAVDQHAADQTIVSPLPDSTTATQEVRSNTPTQKPSALPQPVAASPASAPAPSQDIATGMTASPMSPGMATPPVPEGAAAAASVEKPASKELVKATKDAEKKEVVAQEAEQEVRSLVDRMELLRKDIDLEKQLLATTRKKADIARETEQQLQKEYEDKLRDDAEESVVEALRMKLFQTRQRFAETRRESRERVNRIDELQARYATLQSEQIMALQLAEKARLEAESARKTVEALRNPFTARNITQWLIDHGPRVTVILVAMLVGLWMTRVTKYRIIDLMLKRGGLGKRADRENRARTLVGVFENAAKVSIVCGGMLMVLDAIGAPIATLMGGAAVFGLAVAFGAQSLIKDYFYGFMILLEQQYTINDVIKIGDIAGQVERITLRVTVLRDLEGRVHFIPHGAITSTTNMTHGWSRALFEIGVAYKEDADRVIDLIKQLGQEMRSDPHFGQLILEDLTMLGVDGFGDSAVMIKFFIKTRPLKQWEVKRELLRRVKKTFDEQGIEIPFPHRTVYHRSVEAEEVVGRSEAPLRKSA